MPSRSAAALSAVPSAIDTHVHPWLLSDLPPVIDGARHVRPDLIEDYTPERLVSTARNSGFSRIILVHARDLAEGSLAEARFFLDAARRCPEIVGAVIGIDLLDRKATTDLFEQVGHAPALRGGRMIAPENAGVGILSTQSARDVVALLGELNLTLDLLVRSSNPGQLDEAVALVRWNAAHRNTRIVGDHLLKPTNVENGTPTTEWLTAMKELAKYPCFFLKLSGLPGEVPRGASPEIFFPFFDAALDIFGAERLLFGSDHPVSFDHDAATEAVLDWLASRGMNDTRTLQQIFSNTADRAYAIA